LADGPGCKLVTGPMRLKRRPGIVEQIVRLIALPGGLRGVGY